MSFLNEQSSTAGISYLANQLPGESVEQYITELYALVETCEYGNLTDDMLRDRIVVGIRNAAVSKRLQLDLDLSLEKAKRRVRQEEAVNDQQRLLKGDTSLPEALMVNGVAGKQRNSQRSHNYATAGRTTPRTPRGPFQDRKQICSRCGHNKHVGKEKCPAASATCHKCNKKGHYSAQCFSKTHNNPDKQATAHELSLDTAFLDVMTTNQETTWNMTVTLNTKPVEFKLDTGAAVTAISEEVFKTLPTVQLQKPSKILSGPTKQNLNVMGQFKATLEHKNAKSEQEVFVIQKLQNNLLGLPAITALNILCRIQATYAEDILSQFPEIFTGLGNLGQEYQIQIKPDAQPFALHTSRTVPLPLHDKVQELNHMERGGVISKVDDPTPWCAGMDVVPKKSGAIRICVDLKKLNESVLREVHPLPRVDETLALLAGATVFSKLDANSGFWQIPLAKESRLLTTFITLFGRYCFNKLPFGITSVPELFQKRMKMILEGLSGVVCQMDDILIFGSSQEEHNSRLLAVLQRLKERNVTLNREKCEFSKKSVKFLGHLIDGQGIRADPDKTSGLENIKVPSCVSDLRRFLGMANQLGKFSPRLAELSQPLRELLSPRKSWQWGPAQEQAFSKVKAELAHPTILTLYNPNANLKISADASSFGLGAVLLQESREGWKPVAYASRSMTETERRYAQIEKEALAVTWACDKFADYVIGKHFQIESDHKPLIPLLNSKHLDNLPPRILRFRLRMGRFNYTVFHVPGKLLEAADALSRAPSPSTASQLQEEVEWFVDTVTSMLPASKHRLQEFRIAQDKDSTCLQAKQWCTHGWPTKSPTANPEMIPFWQVRSSFTVCDNLLLHNQCVVIPTSLRKEILQKIHEGHQGIERCRARARCSVWWPGITKQIAVMIRQCHVCAQEAQQRKEPLIKSALPDYPWQIVGTDLFELKGTHYLLVVDNFSRYPEVIKLTSTTSVSTISVLKSIFSRHGIPEVLRSDNGPQYSAKEFSDFAKEYGFHHITSSPRYPQSNGMAERTVQTVKHLLKQSKDPNKALLSYRSTPLTWCNRSPAELCMGRHLRTWVPMADSKLIPQWSYLPEFKTSEAEFRTKQKDNFDKRHRTHDLPPIPDNTRVWIETDNGPTSGRVVSMAETPRSYIIETSTGQLLRNRHHVLVDPRTDVDTDAEPDMPESTERETSEPTDSHRIMTRSQTGTEIRPPSRFS